MEQRDVPEPTTERSTDNVPSDLLKSQILDGWKAVSNVTALSGHRFLAASQERFGRVIVVVDGTFDRSVCKAVKEEAQRAGVKSEKMHIYCEIATYTGAGIVITKFEDVGISTLDRKAVPSRDPVYRGWLANLTEGDCVEVPYSLAREDIKRMTVFNNDGIWIRLLPDGFGKVIDNTVLVDAASGTLRYASVRIVPPGTTIGKMSGEACSDFQIGPKDD
jgi:hypothetical protein